MKLLIIVSLILSVPLLALAQPSRKAFAYDYTIDDLPNGLRVVTIPTDYPNLVALYIVARARLHDDVERDQIRIVGRDRDDAQTIRQIVNRVIIGERFPRRLR